MVKIMEQPIKIDDLGVPLFLETPILASSCMTGLDFRKNAAMCASLLSQKPDLSPDNLCYPPG